jgi:hypothetical protein
MIKGLLTGMLGNFVVSNGQPISLEAEKYNGNVPAGRNSPDACCAVESPSDLNGRPASPPRPDADALTGRTE